MSMKAEGRVGTIAATSGSLNTLRTARDGSLVVQVGGGKYIEAARAGRLFSAANQAAVNTTITLNTNWEGLCVGNPTGSGKNLVMLEFGWAMSIVGASDGTVGLAIAANTTIGQVITPKAAMNGAGTSIAYVDNDVDPTGTQTLIRVCGTAGTGATTTQIAVPQSIYDIGGSIILPPGRAILTYTTTAIAVGAVFYFMWEEINE